MAVNVSVITRMTGVQQVQGGLRSIGGGLDKLSSKALLASKALQVTGQRISSLGTVLSIGITAPLALAAGALIKFAGDAVESENLFEVSMGGMADSARRFSEDLRSTLGLNAFEIRKQVGVFNQMFVSMGLGTKAAFEMSKGMTLLTQDMASFFNLRSDEAFNKLQSAISGEIEPLKRLGIIINETVIKQTALNLGIIKGNETLTEAQKVGVRYIAILERTANAQGDLARTIDSPVNRLRILKTQFDEVIITMGSELLPVVASVTGVIMESLIPAITSWVEAFSRLTPASKGLTLAIGGILVVVGPLLFIFGKIIALVGFLIPVFLAIVSPIGLIVVAIGAVVAAGVLLIAQWDALVNVAATIWSSVKIVILENILAIVDALGGVIILSGSLGDKFSSVRDRIAGLLDEEVVARVESGGASLSESMEEVWAGILATIDETMETAKVLLAKPFEVMGEAAEGAVQDVQDQMEASRLAIIEELKRLGEEAGKTDEKRLKARQKLIDKEKQLALSTLDFEIAIGNKTLEEKVRFLEAELALTKEGTAKQLKFRKLIADAQLAIFRRDLELAQKTFDNNELLMQQWLRNQKERFEQLGESGGLATREINRSIRTVATTSIDVAGIMQRSFTTGLTNILQGGVSFAQGMRNIFASMVDAIIAEFAELAVSGVFDILSEDGVGGGEIDSILSGIGSFVSGFFPHGGSFVTQRPQLIGVGERGAERVTVSPLAGGPVQSGGLSIFSIPILNAPTRTFNRSVVGFDKAVKTFDKVITSIGGGSGKETAPPAPPNIGGLTALQGIRNATAFLSPIGALVGFGLALANQKNLS